MTTLTDILRDFALEARDVTAESPNQSTVLIEELIEVYKEIIIKRLIG